MKWSCSSRVSWVKVDEPRKNWSRNSDGLRGERGWARVTLAPSPYP